MKRRICLLLTMLMITVLLGAGCQTAKKPETAPKSQPKTQAAAPTTLLDAAEKDPYTNGCISCHKKEAKADRSLPAKVKAIAEHPKVTENNVKACYFCHDPQKNFNLYKRFYRGLHKAHWGSSTFYGKLKGQCFSCHTVETNGVSGIKNYPTAGYRESVTGTGTKNKTSGTSTPSGQGTTESNQGTKTTEKTESTEQSKGQTNTSSQSTNNTEQNEVPVPTP